MKKVLIIYRFLPHYRKEFYNGLKNSLAEENIQLELIYGKTNKKEALRNDEIDIEWAQYVPNYYTKLGKIELLWQPVLRHIIKKDLIIVEQANKLIINYLLIILRKFPKFKLGVWGHGRNMQIKSTSLRNKFKSIFLNACDSYFAYTKGVKNFLSKNGLPEDKVVVVQNAIETKELKNEYANISNKKTEELKKKFNITSSNVGIYCGGMYKEKRIDFMLDACYKIKKEVPDFHMIFVGSGIDADKVHDAAVKNDWIHYVGPKLGMERVKYFKISSIQLMPGLVGLGVLDSFALETPLFTTEYPYHSPEIEYLENNVNGMITRNDFDEYTDTIIDVLKTQKYNKLIEGCRDAANIYTIDNMVNNFKKGIIDCISKN